MGELNATQPSSTNTSESLSKAPEETTTESQLDAVACEQAAQESQAAPVEEVCAEASEVVTTETESVEAVNAEDSAAASTGTSTAASAAALTTEQTSAPSSAKKAAKPSSPSPAAFAKRTHAGSVSSSYHANDVIQARTFGRVDTDGTVYVKQDDSERAVGQVLEASSPTEALDIYVQRYLDLKTRVDLFEARLDSASINTREINQSLKQLSQEVKEPQVVGDIQGLQQRIEALTLKAEEKKHEIAAARQAAYDQSVADRTALVEQAEAVAAQINDSTNWTSTAEQFRTLFEQWQHLQRHSARIDHAQADALWQRFSAARATFNQARRKWNQTRDAERNAARSRKEAIIAQAESLKDSTAWGETSRQFSQLLEQWKKAGHVGRRDDDALWTRFRQAADAFYTARQADRDQTNASELENLRKKEALLEQAEALLPVADEKAAAQARKALNDIQDQWDQIGYVPRDDMRRIESRLDAVDRSITAAEQSGWTKRDPEADARKSSFTEQITAQLMDLDERIAKATSEAEKATLQAEKATKELWLNAIK